MALGDDWPDLLTVKEVAKILRVAPLTIKRWGKRGKLPAIRINSRGDRRYKKEAVLWLLGAISSTKSPDQIQMINVAIDAAKQGGQLALSYFQKQLKVNFKPDNSPVTIADKKAEKLIRGIISRKFPDHGIIGEEFPAINPKAKYQWIIDPIDGTRDFARGIQFWCTLIALLENGKPILGVTYFPYSNEVFSAQKGKGAYLNGKRTYVSKINNLKYSYLSISSAYHFATHSKLKNLVKLGESAGAARYISSFSFNYLWKGKIEGYVVGRGGIWDFAAPSIITEEAGGKFSDFNGKNSLDSNCAVFTNGKIHAGVINILKNS